MVHYEELYITDSTHKYTTVYTRDTHILDKIRYEQECNREIEAQRSIYKYVEIYFT